MLAFMLTGGRLLAVSPAETRAWETAVKRFQDAKGPTMLGMVETNFAAFVKKYPASEHYAEAVVFEARALFQQENYDGVIALLGAQSTNAGKAADQFAYWTAKSYAKEKNYALAADTFARLVRENPDSDLRLEAVFREAEAHAKLEYWPRVIEELREPDGVFQRIAKTNRTDDLVVSGLLLLSEAELKQKEYPAAEKTLAGIVTDKLEWERLSLLCRVQLDSGQADAALATSTNLLAAAGAKPDLKGKSVFLQGGA
jgi:tetratricopeptide (TPR) repeat protein